MTAMRKRTVALGRTTGVTAFLVGLLMNAPAQAQSSVSAKQQVMATERAFAKTMADRDQPGFARFISTQAVFFSGEQPTRGKSKIVEGWLNYFKGPQAPFSWEPATVEVLDSGNLALSSGPVRDPAGKLIGTFTSIWRLESPNTWRIVFDKGNDVCNPHS
jgi:ketosteroid isomerase-like protein